MFADLGPSGRLRVFEEQDHIRELATLPNEIFNRFKDLLSQIYVRKARLQRALMMREFLGTEQPASG